MLLFTEIISVIIIWSITVSHHRDCHIYFFCFGVDFVKRLWVSYYLFERSNELVILWQKDFWGLWSFLPLSIPLILFLIRGKSWGWGTWNWRIHSFYSLYSLYLFFVFLYVCGGGNNNNLFWCWLTVIFQRTNFCELIISFP